MRLSFAFAAMLALGGCGGPSQPAPPPQHDHQTIPLESAAETRVRFNMSGGEMHVRGGGSALLDADFTYNVPGWKPNIAHHTTTQPASLDISQGAESASFSQTTNRWDVTLNDTVPMEMVVHVGAGQARLALGSLSLRGVQVEMGAGELDLDLRGTPRQSYEVKVHGGVGSATVHVPSTVAISATATGGLGSISAEGLERRDDRWINPRVPSGPVTITLTVQGGVGEIKLVAE